MALRATRLLPRMVGARRALSVSAWRSHERLHEVLPPLESFARRHIGPSPEDTQEMLRTCGVEVNLRMCVCVLTLELAVSPTLSSSHSLSLPSPPPPPYH